MEEKEALTEDYMLHHTNLHVLINTSVIIPAFPTYRFVGTTLWTEKTPSFTDINDYKYILFTQKDWITRHLDFDQFLKNEVANAS